MTQSRIYFLALHFLFFLSGASALSYEILWSRFLTLIFGNSVFAVSVILSSFMAGLALGGLFGGHLANHKTNSLKTYIYLEFAIGLYALFLPMILPGLAQLPPIFNEYIGDSFFLLTFQRTFFSFLILLFPTILMGATFPVIIRALTNDVTKIGHHVSWLYFANIFGAVAGSFFVTFILIEIFGISTTHHFAASTNFTIAIISLALLKFSPGHITTPTSLPVINTTSNFRFKNFFQFPASSSHSTLIFILFLSGFCAMAYQVIWTRILVVYFTSTIYSFSVVLIVFLLALATGSLVAPRAINWSRNHQSLIASIQISMGFTAVLGIHLSDDIYFWIYKLYPLTESWLQLISVNFTIAFLLIFPSIFLSGMMIPITSRILVQDNRRLGNLMGGIYFINTLGAMIGPVITTFLLIPFLGIKSGFKFLAILQILAGFIFLHLTPEKSSLRKLGFVTAGMGLIFLLLIPTKILTDRLGEGNLASTLSILNKDYYDLLFYKEGSSSTVSVIQNKANGTKLLQINGFSTAGTGSGYAYMKMMGHLPLIIHPHPENTLVIGLGTGTTARSMLLYPIKTVDIAEIDSAVIAAIDHFEGEAPKILKDMRVRLIQEDGRNHLSVSPERYDVITLEPLPPYFSGMVNLYSKEFYQLAREKLNAGGVVCQWLPLHTVSPELLRMMVKSFHESFEETMIWLHPDSFIAFMVGSDKKMNIDISGFDLAMSNPKISSDLHSSGIKNLIDLTNNFVMNTTLISQYVSDSQTITDDFPYLEFLGPKIMKYGVTEKLGENNRSQLNNYKKFMTPEIILTNERSLISFP